MRHRFLIPRVASFVIALTGLLLMCMDQHCAALWVSIAIILVALGIVNTYTSKPRQRHLLERRMR